MFIKRQAFIKCLFKIPLRREIDNATFNFLNFNISTKKFKGKHFFCTGTSWNYLLLNMAVRWGCISRRGRCRGGEGGTNKQPLSDKSSLIRRGEIYST